ncbi:MAG: AmmeMemoRadiSam system radical SAM enzyme [Spartobacteria bacterium]|nr:AmmeMemoRadiSam system radical SAM enzyme [Spartobacteria bacterium]
MNVQCGLCPKECVIAPGESGECRIRVNIDGKLTAVTYGFPCSVHVDPVEKKPLFHFLPGTGILSLATVGCNLHCKNCQNWEISQQNPEHSTAYPLPPEELPGVALRQHCRSVAFTYTDPVVYYEYALEASQQAHAAGLKNVLVSAAYINPVPWRALCAHADAANIDLKAYSDEFYRTICDATLRPVLDALVAAKGAGVMVEMTNLVIPTLNDSDNDIRQLCQWIRTYMGRETPLHFSRFFPHYRMRNLPPTPEKTLLRAREIARSEGLDFVYIGNLISEDGENTYCPSCARLLVKRKRYTVLANHIKDGRCAYCDREIYGIWQ